MGGGVASLIRSHEIDHRSEVDVSEEVVGLNEVVAGVQVPIVLEGKGEPARLGEDAQARGLTVPVRKGDVEHLNVHAAYVVLHPLVEDLDEELAIAARVN